MANTVRRADRSHLGRRKRTKKADQIFFDALSEGSSISKAARDAGYSKRSVYDYRKQDEEFSERMEEALDAGTDALEDEATRRAVEGVEKPVGFFQGKAGAYVYDYSDNLLMFMLKARRPEKFADRQEVNQNVTGDITFKTVYEAPKDPDND